MTDFITFISFVHLNKLVQALFGLDFLVQILYFVQEHLVVLVTESGREHCNVQVVLISYLHSAEQKCDSVRVFNLVVHVLRSVQGVPKVFILSILIA